MEYYTFAIPSTFIIRTSVRKTCPFFLIYFFAYLYQYGLMNIYFILWFIIKYHCHLFCCSNYSTFCHWELSQDFIRTKLLFNSTGYAKQVIAITWFNQNFKLLLREREGGRLLLREREGGREGMSVRERAGEREWQRNLKYEYMFVHRCFYPIFCELLSGAKLAIFPFPKLQFYFLIIQILPLYCDRR